MDYCCTDSEITYKLHDKFNVWNFHSSITSVCGLESQRIMSTGNVESSYGLICDIAEKRGVVIDKSNRRIFRPTGGLEIDTKIGAYENVYCIDLSALYPNIVIEHNIDCLSEIMKYYGTDNLSNEENKAMGITKMSYYYKDETNNFDILCDSRGNRYAFSKDQIGIIPESLLLLLNTREKAKNDVKEAEKKGDLFEIEKCKGDEQARANY